MALHFATAFAAPVPGDALIDVELSHVQVTCAKPSDAGETEVVFRLRSKEPGWVLWSTPIATRAAEDSVLNLPYRVTFGPGEEDGSIPLQFHAKHVPSGKTMKLRKTLYLTRSMMGRILPPQTIEAGADGKFEMGGIPFRYTYTPGEKLLREGGMSLRLGHLTLSYPVNVHLANLVVTAENGWQLVERHRSAGKASFDVLSHAMGNNKFTIQATLSNAEEELEVTFNKQLSLDGVVGEKRKLRGKPLPDVLTAYRAHALAALSSSSATCDAEVRLNRLRLMERDENDRPCLTLDLEVGGSEGQQLFMKGPNQQVTARDAEGNVLTGYYFSSYTNEGRNRPLEAALSFHDHLPAGGWIELDSA